MINGGGVYPSVFPAEPTVYFYVATYLSKSDGN